MARPWILFRQGTLFLFKLIIVGKWSTALCLTFPLEPIWLQRTNLGQTSTCNIAARVIGALKHLHHNKVAFPKGAIEGFSIKIIIITYVIENRTEIIIIFQYDKDEVKFFFKDSKNKYLILLPVVKRII